MSQAPPSLSADPYTEMEEKMKADKGKGGGGVDLTSSDQLRRTKSSFPKPSWLLFTLADLDEKMKMMAPDITEEDKGDTLAERAEAYYRKRPQLLAVLQDLYNGYLSLSHRYCQTLAKHKQQHNHHRRQLSFPLIPAPAPAPALRFDSDEDDDGVDIDIDSDAESSLSYQPPFPIPAQPKVVLDLDTDNIVSALVIKTVDYEILVDELNRVERRWGESSKKIELQKSLLEVLESERLILLNENVRLGYRVASLVEENKGLASESMFMKRKAGELARCVLKMREEHRVCMLSRKIEDLQGQIYGLEKRNKEYYQQLVKQQEEKKGKSKTTQKLKSKNEVTLEDCFQVDETTTSTRSTSSVVNVIPKSRRHALAQPGGGGGARVSKFWDRVKNFDMFQCGPHFNSTCC